jgi:hypothetical protein
MELWSFSVVDLALHNPWTLWSNPQFRVRWLCFHSSLCRTRLNCFQRCWQSVVQFGHLVDIISQLNSPTTKATYTHRLGGAGPGLSELELLRLMLVVIMT